MGSASNYTGAVNRLVSVLECFHWNLEESFGGLACAVIAACFGSVAMGSRGALIF